jgi:Flp pilus assembly protein TadD
MLLLLGRPQEALPEFGRALALSPRDAQAYNNRGVALQALGQAEVARRDFEHALQLDPCLFDPRYNLMRLGTATQPSGNCRYSAEQQRLLASHR